MKDNTQLLTIITYAVILLSVTTLLNDIREFNYNQFENFTSWAKDADKNETWLTSKNAIKWSFSVLNLALFFFRGYLIYGVFQFTKIMKYVEEGNYFSDENIGLFKKIGNIFITYVINVFVLKAILTLISGESLNFMRGDEFVILLPAGLGFYVLASIFKRAKELQEDNDLTV